MDKEKLLKLMRDDYRNQDIRSLKRHLSLGHWILSKEEKGKIANGIKMLEKKELHPLMKEALRLLGGKIVDG